MTPKKVKIIKYVTFVGGKRRRFCSTSVKPQKISFSFKYMAINKVKK